MLKYLFLYGYNIFVYSLFKLLYFIKIMWYPMIFTNNCLYRKVGYCCKYFTSEYSQIIVQHISNTNNVFVYVAIDVHE